MGRTDNIAILLCYVHFCANSVFTSCALVWKVFWVITSPLRVCTTPVTKKSGLQYSLSGYIPKQIPVMDGNHLPILFFPGLDSYEVSHKNYTEQKYSHE